MEKLCSAPVERKNYTKDKNTVQNPIESSNGDFQKSKEYGMKMLDYLNNSGMHIRGAMAAGKKINYCPKCGFNLNYNSKEQPPYEYSDENADSEIEYEKENSWDKIFLNEDNDNFFAAACR